MGLFHVVWNDILGQVFGMFPKSILTHRLGAPQRFVIMAIVAVPTMEADFSMRSGAGRSGGESGSALEFHDHPQDEGASFAFVTALARDCA